MRLFRLFPQFRQHSRGQHVPRYPHRSRNQVYIMSQTDQANQMNQAIPTPQWKPNGPSSHVTDELIALFKSLGGTYLRGANAEATARFVREVFVRINDPKVRGPLLQALTLAAEGVMRDRQYDPTAAIVPAGHLIRAVEAIQVTSAAVRAWAAQPPRKTSFDWFRPNMFWGNQKLTLKLKIAQLESALEAAADSCDYTGSRIRQQYSLLNLLTPQYWLNQAFPTPARQVTPGTQCPESPYPVPLAGYSTLREQAIAVRAAVGEFADTLSTAAGESAALINASRASDGTGVNPVTVQAQGRSMAKLVYAGLLACRALGCLLDRPLAAPAKRARPKRAAENTGVQSQHAVHALNGARPPLPTA